MPTHPYVIRAMGEQAWEERRLRLLRFLRFLSRDDRIAVLDYSRIESFHG